MRFTMAENRLVSLLNTQVFRFGILGVSVVLLCTYVVSPYGLGLCPFAKASLALAIAEADLLAFPRDGKPVQTIDAGTLLEVVTSGAFGTVVRPQASAEAAREAGTLWISGPEAESLRLISLLKVKNDLSVKATPGPVSRDGARIPKGSVGVVAGYRNGWVDLRTGSGTGWVPASALENLSGPTGSTLAAYGDPDLVDKKLSLPAGTELNVVARYGDAYLVTGRGFGGRLWVSVSESGVK